MPKTDKTPTPKWYKTQAAIEVAVEESIRTGQAPTFSEIARRVNMSVNTVIRHMGSCDMQAMCARHKLQVPGVMDAMMSKAIADSDPRAADVALKHMSRVFPAKQQIEVDGAIAVDDAPAREMSDEELMALEAQSEASPGGVAENRGADGAIQQDT